MDLQSELSGQLLQEDFVVNDRTFTMRLLNEEEHAWTYSLISTNNHMSLAMSVRVANLAIGIRSINDMSIESQFEDAFNKLPEEEKVSLIDGKPIKFAYAALFLRWLSEQPPVFVTELHNHWNSLEKRRADAQGDLKNSSGESSEKEEKQS